MFSCLGRIHQGIKNHVEAGLVVSLAGSQGSIEARFNRTPQRSARPLLVIRYFPLNAIARFGRAGPRHGRPMVSQNTVAIQSGSCCAPANRQGHMVAAL